VLRDVEVPLDALVSSTADGHDLWLERLGTAVERAGIWLRTRRTRPRI
jgi:hypothetical protein